MNPQPSLNLSEFAYFVSHFDGNNNDRDDLAALPVAAMLTNAAGLQQRSIFAFNNNLNEPNRGNQADLMRESAAFAQKLGIETVDYDFDQQAATRRVVELFNSGEKVLSLEGGPMEMVYRALSQTDPQNLQNITLVSHSSWNEKRAEGERSGGGTPRTWADIGSDFPEVERIDIRDQNGPDYEGPAGFYSADWTFLDSTDNPVLQAGRALMQNVLGPQVNDASDAGMQFFALTGNQQGTPQDVAAFLEQNPVAFVEPVTSGVAVQFEAAATAAPSPELNVIEQVQQGRVLSDLAQPVPVRPDPVQPDPAPPRQVPQASPQANPAQTDSAVYQMQEGRLILEAESSALEGNWERISVAGRTAALYDGPNSFSQKPEGQTLSYDFLTDEAGIYDLSIFGARLNSAQSPGESQRSDLGNDVYVEMIDVATGGVVQSAIKQYIQLDYSNREFRWGNTFDQNGRKSQAKIELEGDRQYRLQITGRSDGFMIDRLTLGNDGRFRDADSPESPLVGSGPQPEQKRFEAEDFQLSGEYRPERIGIASGEQVISLIGGETEGEGSAAFEFDGVSGLYNIRVAYFDESDGVGQLRLNQGEETLFDIALDQELGSVIAKPQTAVTKELSNIQVSVGDRFELFAQEDGIPSTGEHMRIDYLEFIPVESALPSLGSTSADPAGNSLPGAGFNPVNPFAPSEPLLATSPADLAI